MPIKAKEFDRLQRIKEANEKWGKDENYRPGNKKKKFWCDPCTKRREGDDEIPSKIKNI